MRTHRLRERPVATENKPRSDSFMAQRSGTARCRWRATVPVITTFAEPETPAPGLARRALVNSPGRTRKESLDCVTPRRS